MFITARFIHRNYIWGI